MAAIKSRGSKIKTGARGRPRKEGNIKESCQQKNLYNNQRAERAAEVS